MTFAKNIKWQLVLAALGVSLLMTTAIRAQEIENTDFAVPAASVGGNFNTPSAAANTAMNNSNADYAAVSEASILPANQPDEASLGSGPRTIGSLLAIGVVLIACGMLWKSSGNRRNDTLKIHNSLSMRKNPLPNRKAQALHS